MKELIEELRQAADVKPADCPELFEKAADAIESQAATIARYETTAENYELLQAKVDEQGVEIELLKRKNERQRESIKRYQDEGQGSLLELGMLRLELAALKAQPGDPVATIEVIVEGSCKLIDFDGQKAAFKLPAGIHNLYAAP